MLRIPHDFFAPDPHFGDMAKLKELSDKCHDKGMKLMLDVVVNHTGYNHPYVNDPTKKDWFNREGNIRGLGQYHMERAALAGLPDLNQDNPEVARHLIDAHKSSRGTSRSRCLPRDMAITNGRKPVKPAAPCEQCNETLHSHPAHAIAPARARGFCLPLRQLGDQRLRGEHERGHRRGVLERHAHDFGRIDDARED